jgi:hypothetical protein
MSELLSGVAMPTVGSGLLRRCYLAVKFSGNAPRNDGLNNPALLTFSFGFSMLILRLLVNP